MNFTKRLIVKPGASVKLKHYATGDTFGLTHSKQLKAKMDAERQRLDDLQYLLYAEAKHTLLIVLQGIDSAGKDGTIRHVISGVNPQGCQVHAFKVPTPEEAAHDFLWRVHKAVPERGMIGIFNRSHYEDVLVVRVHKLVRKDVWKQRYHLINEFEKELADSGVVILKFFLHISREEQKRRIEARIDDPHRNWKLSDADIAEMQYYDEYAEAYEDAIARCSTEYAPWFIVPSDHKWFRNYAISKILVEALEDLKMKFPKPKLSRELK